MYPLADPNVLAVLDRNSQLFSVGFLMDEFFVNLLPQLNTLSPLGVIALLGLIIFMLVKAKAAKVEMDTKVSNIAENHLHGLPEMTESLKRIESVLSNINDNIIHVKARINGGHQ